MKKEATAKETEYEIGKYFFLLLEKNGILTHEQYLTLRDNLIDVYDPVIGALERGLDYNIRRIEFAPALLHPVSRQGYLRRVAAYARVSTESLEQEASLDAQREYFEEYIKAHENWSCVGIYFDSGLSGLSHRKREGFNTLIEDALSGKIDLIVTKSLSRFARNTVDTLTIIRKLKAANVEVYFQKENVYTLDSKGEFLLTLMSSIAQEESRSISENITWGQRKRFADGRYSVPYKRFLGYDQGGKNCLVINESQARTVRLIYRLYLTGLTEKEICKCLEKIVLLHHRMVQGGIKM